MPLTLPIAPQELLLFASQLFYSLRSRVIYTGSIGVGFLWGCPYGVGELHDDDDDDDDGHGWYGDMIMLALHLMIDFQFMIQSSLWLLYPFFHWEVWPISLQCVQRHICWC